MNESQLRKRCAKFLEPFRVGMEPVYQHPGDEDGLYSFIMSEIARAADERFDDKSPLVLFFDNPVDRKEFVEIVHAAKPGMVSKSWP